MKFDFSGKTVLLTGAASGIALLAAKEFAAMYANVVLIDINEEKLIEVTQQIAPLRLGRRAPAQRPCSSLRSTRARNKQKTWPRIASSQE